jgi:hypothetical protein
VHVDTFPYLADHSYRLSRLPTPLSAPETVELLCSDCPFYHADREEELECGSFRILRRLLENGRITPADITDACG